MAVGLISSPASWVNGTVAPATWFTNVQDTLNSLYTASGTYALASDVAALLAGTGNHTFSRLQVDGTGAAAITADAGQLRVQQTTDLFKPTILVRDTAGNNRWLADHNGYPMGRLGDFSEAWNFKTTGLITTDPVPNTNTWWRAAQTGAGSGYSLDTGYPSSGAPWRAVYVAAGATINFESWLTTADLFGADTFLCAVFEWEMAAAPSASDTTGTTFTAGLSNNQTILSAARTGIALVKRPADANWQLASSSAAGGAITFASTGTAFVAGAWVRCRVEFHGSGTPGGLRAIGWVNESATPAVITSVSSLPTAAETLGFGFGIKATAAPSTTGLLVTGPIRGCWNRALSISAL